MKRLVLAVMVASLVMVGLANPNAQAQDDVEITFVHIFGADENDFRAIVIQEIADEFMAQNPNVTVNIESPSTDYSELYEASVLGLAQGTGPHIVQIDESLTQNAIDSQLFLPISDLASEEQVATLDDILPVVREFFVIDDALWGLPWNNSNPILYYNRGYFEAAGLDPDVVPTTFDEVLATCEALMAAEIEGMSGCLNGPLVSWFAEQWMAMQGAPMLNNDNGRSGRASEILLTSPEMTRIAEWWQEMSDRGYWIYSGVTRDYNGAGLQFLGGASAMHLNSTAGISLIQAFSAAQGIDLGIAPLFKPTQDATNGVTVGGASVFVSAGKSDAETQAAIDFAFFLTNTENIAIFHMGTGYYPNRQSTIDLLTNEGWFDLYPCTLIAVTDEQLAACETVPDETNFYEFNPAFEIALNQVLNSEPSPATAGMVVGAADEIRGIVEQTIQSIIDGGEDVGESLEAGKARIDAVLADYNSLFE